MDSVKLINDYIKQADWRINENANMSYSYPGMLGYVVGHSTAEYGLSEIYPFESSKAHKEGFIHIHDLSGLCNYSYFGKETVCVIYKGKRMYLSFEQLYDLVEEDEVLFNEKDGAYVKYPVDLKVKDKGSMVNVSRVVKKKKQHNLHYIKAKNGFAQIVTSNHPIITTDGDIPAKDVNENHIIETFYETLNGDVTSLNIVEQIATKFDISNYTVNGKSYDRDTNNNGQVSIKNMHCTMNSELELNPDLGWLLGMMIAEGSTNHNSISLSQTSGDICTKIIDILNRLNVPYQVDSINNVNNIRIKSKIFANLYISMFGNKRSNGKCLPVNFVEYNKDFLLGIVAGICDGDGSKNENSVNKSRNIKIRMTSRTLLNQIAYILRSVGINARDNKPYFNEQSKTGFKSNFPVYTIVFTVENGALPESIKCNSIKNKGKLNTNVANSVYSFGDGECNIIQNIPLDFLQVENVYDITTSTQQFICNGILSHNCLGLDFEMFLYKGINDDFGSPKHFTSALSQLHNAIFLISQQIAGAVAFNSVDILLAPYIKQDGLTYKQVKQALQEFVCTINIKGRIGYQSPFLNWQLDVTVPKRLQGRHPVIAGEIMDFLYDDCKWEIETINKALLEIMSETKAVLAFPVINIGITKNFNWDNKLAETIFTSIGNTGQPTINNYVNSCYDPDAVKSMCCSLRLDMAKIMKQTGGSFGAADNSGSTGVVTLDLPVYGYLSGGDEAILKWYIQKYTKVAFTALVAKRKFIEQRMKDGWYPTVNRFIDDFSHFFNTIGVIGLHEMLLNMGKPGIDTEEGSLFAQKVLDYINELIGEFQVENKDFYGTNRGLIANLELVPGEGCCHRLAIHNKKVYPDIITQGSDKGVYYTRGCWLPANKDYSLVFAANNQDALQEKFSGGANFQYYLNEPIHDWKATRSIVRKLVENTSLPFISLSPTISVCPICGRLQDNKDYCQHDLTEDQIEELKKKGVEVVV